MHSPYSRSPFGTPLTPDEVVRQLQHLPSAPKVLPRLKQLLVDANSSIRDVVDMIRLDPGIAARVLQMGNSAYFSQGLRCYTVEEAVNRVGYDQVYELVANAVASHVLVRPLAVYGLEADQLWERSVACALAAELLAERIEVDRDIAYTVGLLHGVGMVAIDEWAFRQHPELRFAPATLPLETCEAERATLGFHNAEVGAALLRFWEFPAVMSEPVRWQYMPRSTAAHFKTASIVAVAKWLRSTVCHPSIPLRLPDPLALQALKLRAVELDGLAGLVRARLSQVSTLLEPAGQEQFSLPFPNGERALQETGFSRNAVNL